MAPRRLEHTLTLAAAGLLVVQLALLGALHQQPDPPDELPPQEGLAHARLPTEPPAAEDNHRTSVELLDRLLAARLADAIARHAPTSPPGGPSAEVRAAALAHPDPMGPEVKALLDAYAAALSVVGETLDATSSLASAASPGTPGPAPAPPPTPPPPGSPARSGDAP